VALHVVAQLVADGEVLGLDVMTTPSESSTYACSWGEWLTFCVCVSYGQVHCTWVQATEAAEVTWLAAGMAA
jgi:hypothetical protein